MLQREKELGVSAMAIGDRSSRQKPVRSLPRSFIQSAHVVSMAQRNIHWSQGFLSTVFLAQLLPSPHFPPGSHPQHKPLSPLRAHKATLEHCSSCSYLTEELLQRCLIGDIQLLEEDGLVHNLLHTLEALRECICPWGDGRG